MLNQIPAPNLRNIFCVSHRFYDMGSEVYDKKGTKLI